MTAQAGDTASLSSRKAALRKSVRQLRRAVPPADRRRAARQAAVHLARIVRACSARHVAAYLSLPEEIDTAPLLALLRRQRCVLYVPKLAGSGPLRFTRLDAPLRHNRYGIAEPVTGRRPARLDLIVLPVVAFDEEGRRLGMGGGYYDRLLARPRPWRRPLRIGLAYATQQVATVPANARDARLDAVVTERGLRRF